jgi:hypothetical protein
MLYAAVGGVLNFLNWYFIIIQSGGISPDKFGIKYVWSQFMGIGFYVYAILSLVFLFIMLKEMGVIDKLTKKAEAPE